jgi:hypothetical protein
MHLSQLAPPHPLLPGFPEAANLLAKALLQLMLAE